MASSLWDGRRWQYIVAVHGTDPIDNAEWDTYCQLFARIDAPERVRGFTLTQGSAPTSHQRRQLKEAHRTAGVPEKAVGAIVTDSAIVRGAITTLAWLGVGTGTRAFRPSDFPAALRHVDIDPEEEAAFIAELARLGEMMGAKNPLSTVSNSELRFK